MRLSSRFSGLVIAVSAFSARTFGLSGTATAATDPSGGSALPSITVQAPKPVARPHRTVPRAVARPAPRAARRTASRAASPAVTTQPAGQESVLERLKRLERTSRSCDERCQKISSQPGCSASVWPTTSVGLGCGNSRHFFTHYVQCTDHLYFLAWKPREAWWYRTSLALNK
jgi:hypothetical protein